MRYRIIHEVNGNYQTHFELQFLTKNWYGGDRWANTQTWHGSTDGFSVTKKYDSLEDVMKVVRSRKIARTVCKEGDVYE